MKKLLIAAVLLMAVGANAQNSAVFFGAGYQQVPDDPNVQNGLVLGYGFAQKLGPVWAASWARFGKYGSWEAEVLYFPMSIPIGQGKVVSVGLSAGPAADWLTIEGEADPIVYLTTAAGGIITWDLARFEQSPGKFTNVGLFAYGKYKFKLEETQYYQDGYLVGGALFASF